jgi:hypothetical protein
MGKGLGLTKNSKGDYFAFSAGTGILVFIDLIAKIALGELGLIPEEDQLHPGFKLHLFASFRNEEEGIGLDLLNAL